MTKRSLTSRLLSMRNPVPQCSSLLGEAGGSYQSRLLTLFEVGSEHIEGNEQAPGAQDNISQSSAFTENKIHLRKIVAQLAIRWYNYQVA